MSKLNEYAVEFKKVTHFTVYVTAPDGDEAVTRAVEQWETTGCDADLETYPDIEAISVEYMGPAETDD